MFITLVIEKWHVTFHPERRRWKEIRKAATKESVLLVFVPNFTKENVNDYDYEVPNCARSPGFIMQYLTTDHIKFLRQCRYEAFNLLASELLF